MSRQGRDEKPSWLRWIVAAVLASATSATQAAETSPERPLDNVERAAVELLAFYCSGGPSLVYDRLSDRSELRTAFDRAEALEEIEVRLGPPCRTSYTLQTPPPELAGRIAIAELELESGVDDVLFLEFDPEAAEPQVTSIRCLADPIPGPADDGGAGRQAVSYPSSLDTRAAAVALVLVLLLSAGIARKEHAWAPIAVMAVLGTVHVLGCARSAEVEAVSSSTDAAPSGGRLGELLEERRALAAGRAFDSEPLSAEGGYTDWVTRLWSVQQRLNGTGDLEVVWGELEAVGLYRLPLWYMVRARVGLFADDSSLSAAAYDAVIALVGGYDGLLLEAASVLLLQDYSTRSQEVVSTALAAGARNASFYYLSARDGALHYRERAEEMFREAWRLRPLPRREVLADPLLALLMDPARALYREIGFGGSVEPVVISPRLGTSPVKLPAEATVTVVGEELRVALSSGSTLVVPGGAALAPPGSPATPADAQVRGEEKEALAKLDSLRAAIGDGRLQGRNRREIELAAGALARERRWNDLLTFTAGVESSVAASPPEVVRYRARALEQTQQTGASTQLMMRLGVVTLEQKRHDPATFYQLADRLAREEQYDTAIRLVRRAAQQFPLPAAERLVSLYRLERGLSESFETHSSEHFEVRVPPGRKDLARRVALILEAEHKRLRFWIRVPSTVPRTRVELLSLDDFSETYGGGIELLGQYDGRIRVPFADVYGLSPFLVSVLSHELAHAMIADATKGQAPKWVHEGMAQRIEMHRRRINPMADYYRAGWVLGLPVLELVLETMTNPKLVATAYDQALWLCFYLESEHGVETVRRLLRLFAEGASTQDAVARATGLTPRELDERAIDWWLQKSRHSWEMTVHRYEDLVDPYVQRPGETPFEIRLNTRWWESQ